MFLRNGGAAKMEKDNKLKYVFVRKLCKENLNRIYSSCIVFFVVFLVMGSMGLYVKGNVKSTVLTIAVPVAMICFCVIGFFISRLAILPKYKKYQEACYLSFWGIMMAGTLLWLMQYTEAMQITVLYGIFLLMFSAVPILPIWWYGSYFFVQAVTMLFVLLRNSNIGIEYFLCIGSWNVFSLCLIFSRYKRFYEKVKNEYKIKEAIILSETDPMTKLLNRRGLERSIEAVWPHCVRQSVPAAVVMIDIDDFKKYNDSFGHDQGDRCIQQVSKMIQKSAKRKTDLAARIGGEEFLVFLSDLDNTQAVLWAKNLKASIDSMALPHAGRSTLPIVTVSMGISWIIPPNGKEISMKDSFEYMKLEADRQLYLAKENGKACLYYDGKAYGKRGINEYVNLLHGIDKKKMIG